jgi:hypothetical protein
LTAGTDATAIFGMRFPSFRTGNLTENRVLCAA